MENVYESYSETVYDRRYRIIERGCTTDYNPNLKQVTSIDIDDLVSVTFLNIGDTIKVLSPPYVINIDLAVLMSNSHFFTSNIPWLINRSCVPL